LNDPSHKYRLLSPSAELRSSTGNHSQSKRSSKGNFTQRKKSEVSGAPHIYDINQSKTMKEISKKTLAPMPEAKKLITIDSESKDSDSMS